MNIMHIFKFWLFILNNNFYHYSIKQNPSGIYQIRGHYSILNYTKVLDPLKYGTKARRKLKYSCNKKRKGEIEDHHIIPKEFEKHRLLKDVKFDVCCSNNIYIMPSQGYGLNDNDSQIYHTNHRLYNLYVKEIINNIYTNNIDDSNAKKLEFILFFYHLKKSLDNNDDYLKTLFQ